MVKVQTLNILQSQASDSLLSPDSAACLGSIYPTMQKVCCSHKRNRSKGPGSADQHQAGIGYDGITHLMTYPSMFMGVGNLVCMPLAMAIGRRPVYLGSLVILIVGGVLAAYAKDYTWHLGARMLLGFAAGNSEALVPMMIQVCGKHERMRSFIC